MATTQAEFRHLYSLARYAPDRSRRIESRSTLFVLAWWSRPPARVRPGPSIASVHGGLSGSTGLREARFGGFEAVALFICVARECLHG
jgi:hypothetical protein